MPNVIPLLLCLAACGGLSALWSYIAYRLTDKIPPKRTLIVYDNGEAYKNGAKITRKYDNRFKVVERLSQPARHRTFTTRSRKKC